MARTLLLSDKLTGAQIIERLQRGHMVRRACWQDDVYIRITNEDGFDGHGLAIFNDTVPLYTKCTNGYLLHIGYSSQPFRKVRVFHDAYDYTEASQDGEGVAMLFATDWEDYGFISKSGFHKLTDELKDKIRENHDKLVQEAIETAKMQGDVK